MLLVGCATPSGLDQPESQAGDEPIQLGGPRKISVEPGTLKMRPPGPMAGRPGAPRMGPSPGTPLPTSLNPETDAYRLQPGDGLYVILRDIPQAGTYEEVVDENGNIALPYIPELKVSEFTAAELEKIVHKQYVPDYYRHVVVTVMVPTQRSIFIQGEVRAPGRHAFVPGMTLSEAITSVGGETPFGNGKKVKILRKGKTTIHNLEKIRKQREADPPLQPGDFIIVSKKRW